MVDVSIIIVAWNVRKLLYDCLKSVFDETRGITFKVIYVDNDSQDGSVAMVEKEFPDVEIIKNQKNEGFIRANNQAIAVAEGRYVLLLNSDTIVLDNAIAKTVWFADQNPKAAVVGCKVLNPDRTIQRTCSMYLSLLNLFLSATYLYKIFPKSRFFGRRLMTWWDYDTIKEVDAICGCFLLARSEAIKEVGLMNEIYFTYGDDPDWCIRFKRRGWKILFTPNAQIIHLGGQTTKQFRRKFRLQLHGSELIFIRLYQKHFFFARLTMALFLLLRFPYWLIGGAINNKDRDASTENARTYLIGAYYCLTNWTKLLMNKEDVCEKLREYSQDET